SRSGVPLSGRVAVSLYKIETTPVAQLTSLEVTETPRNIPHACGKREGSHAMKNHRARIGTLDPQVDCVASHGSNEVERLAQLGLIATILEAPIVLQIKTDPTTRDRSRVVTGGDGRF